MSVLHKERAARAQRAIDTQRTLYRHELQRATDDRREALAQGEAATERIARLLPGAVEAGLPIVKIAEITGISRPTIYRMLSEARTFQDLRGLAEQLRGAVSQLSDELSRPALPGDLATCFRVSVEEVHTLLAQALRQLAAEFDRLGPTGPTLLVELLPALGTPEKVVLNLLLVQHLPTEDVARSTKLSQTQVLSWAALALIRVLPVIRQRAGTGFDQLS